MRIRGKKIDEFSFNQINQLQIPDEVIEFFHSGEKYRINLKEYASDDAYT